MTFEDEIVETIRRDGPMTVAAFMERALYDPARGYYATRAQRSGRAGDFYTSVDAGPVYGSLVATLVARCSAALEPHDHGIAAFDLVDAGAGNGRLARDVLDALGARHPGIYARTGLHLVERSTPARAAQASVLGPHVCRLASTGDQMPRSVRGLVFANELLDALPVHQVVATADGLREVVVDVGHDRLVTARAPLSTPAIAAYFDELGISLEPGRVAEVNLAALDWVSGAASALERGYLVIVDYGHDATSLFDDRHHDGTLVGYWRHLADAPLGGPASTRPRWLERPGEQDLTTHVDLTSVQRSAERAGLEMVARLDQTRFLLALDLGGELEMPGTDVGSIRRRLAARTLVHPSGLGGSHRVLVFRTPGLEDDLSLGAIESLR